MASCVVSLKSTKVRIDFNVFKETSSFKSLSVLLGDCNDKEVYRRYHVVKNSTNKFSLTDEDYILELNARSYYTVKKFKGHLDFNHEQWHRHLFKGLEHLTYDQISSKLTLDAIRVNKKLLDEKKVHGWIQMVMKKRCDIKRFSHNLRKVRR